MCSWNLFSRNKALLKPIQGAYNVSEASGAEVLASANDVFVQIDPTFKGYLEPGNFKSADDIPKTCKMTTRKTEIAIYELQRDATLRQMFEWLAEKLGKTLDNLCLTQHQIKNLASRSPHLLMDSSATFLLFKSGDQLCVALVSARKRETLALDLRLLDLPIEWLGEFHPHVIIPK